VVFTSLDYALLLALTALAYWGLPARAARPLLLLASLLFYAFWSVPWLALLLACVAIGFAGALAIERMRARPTRSRAALALSVVALLGVLGWFKYAGFFAASWSVLGGRHFELAPIVLPLAISFYVFQIVGYLVDVWRGREAETSPLRFSLFVCFFPQLVAGPIARAHQLLPQLERRGAFDAERTLRAVELIAYGVVKKTVFADNLAVYVDRVYASPQLAGGLDVAIATLAFGAQIYCDFSGYTDIARGSGRLFGIELPENFRSPYLAASLREFWRRWHVTLSTWLRDYLYVPLGGGRGSPPRVAANLLVTMILGGLWHGAGVTFLLWGAYHGLLLVGERALRGRAPAGRPRGLPRSWLGVGVTFPLVQAGWLLFRAEDPHTLAALLRALIERPLASFTTFDTVTYLPLVVAAYLLQPASAWLRARGLASAFARRAPLAVSALIASTLLVVVFGGTSDAFIYFQF
jgi:D-alanyl-lipoteichoic acid acyltransferase DltB (MBOAT superfamily)